MKVKVVIVAGGSGKRMNSSIPKQFLSLLGKPILVHTIQRFLQVVNESDVLVVMNQKHFQDFELLNENYFQGKIQAITGGKERTDSVRNALLHLQSKEGNFEGFVMIHDSVRPLISAEIIQKCLSDAKKYGNSVAVTPAKSSLRIRTPQGSKAVDRRLYFEVQTPQTFLFSKILSAYKLENQIFTDDASLMEKYEPIHLTELVPENLKITTSMDMYVAEYLMNQGF